MIEPEYPPSSTSGPDPTAADDLRLRYRALLENERAARGEVRRLARELGLTRRLLRFYLGTLPPPRTPDVTPAAGPGTVLLSETLVYHLDECEDRGTRTAIAGWAFRPAPGWNARATAVTLLLRHEDTVYVTACREVPRPDVAALYARQAAGDSGGATGLEGAGFACEVRHDELPADTEWKIFLRLECAGRACEQFTGRFLRL